MTFAKATKKQSRLRLALVGPAGSGKTYSALRIATALGGKVAVLDTERGSASKYSDEFAFDVAELEKFAPADYVRTIQAADAAGYDVLVIDSLSHAWSGKGGALEQVDAASARFKGNSYMAWRDVTPEHNGMVDAILHCRAHVIVTMRTKTAYEVVEDERGKKVPKKIGLAPIQRDGLEYEFDVVGDIDTDHRLIVSKTRCRALDGMVFTKPGEDVAALLKAWLGEGEAPAPRPAAAPKVEEPYQFVADAIGDVEAAKSLQALNRITVRASVSEWCKGAEKEEFIRARDARRAEIAPAKAGTP